MTQGFSLSQQIEEVEREIALRVDVYKRKYIGRDQSRGEYHLARMRAVLATLQWLRENETDVRAYAAATKMKAGCVLGRGAAEAADK